MFSFFVNSLVNSEVVNTKMHYCLLVYSSHFNDHISIRSPISTGGIFDEKFNYWKIVSGENEIRNKAELKTNGLLEMKVHLPSKKQKNLNH